MALARSEFSFRFSIMNARIKVASSCLWRYFLLETKSISGHYVILHLWVELIQENERNTESLSMVMHACDLWDSEAVRLAVQVHLAQFSVTLIQKTCKRGWGYRSTVESSMVWSPITHTVHKTNKQTNHNNKIQRDVIMKDKERQKRTK